MCCFVSFGKKRNFSPVPMLSVKYRMVFAEAHFEDIVYCYANDDCWLAVVDNGSLEYTIDSKVEKCCLVLAYLSIVSNHILIPRSLGALCFLYPLPPKVHLVPYLTTDTKKHFILQNVSIREYEYKYKENCL